MNKRYITISTEKIPIYKKICLYCKKEFETFRKDKTICTNTCFINLLSDCWMTGDFSRVGIELDYRVVRT